MISRRTALKGIGVSLTLPWMASAQAISSLRPVRSCYIFMPNGFIMPDWNVQGEGADYELSKTLKVLEPFKKDFNIYANLDHQKAKSNGDGAGDHARCSGTFLTGVQLKKTSGKDLKAGISVDQVAAARIGKLTEFPSLEVGCERGQLSGGCDSGYSCAYSSNISWKSPNMPMVKEVNPRLVFSRLFGDPAQQMSKREIARRASEEASVLDLVAGESKDLMKKLGSEDRHKLNEYLESVRAVEKRLQTTEKSSPKIDIPKMPKGIPTDLKEHIKLMYDMIVLAFQADKTRIATMALGNGGSNRRYTFLDINEGHHALSHHKEEQDKVDMIKKIDKFQVEQFGYFLRRLKETSDGESNLLENSQILFGSAISDGNRHSHENLPIILAGNAGGKIKTGEYRSALKNTPLCNLFLSMLNNVGVREKRFGDSTGRYI